MSGARVLRAAFLASIVSSSAVGVAGSISGTIYVDADGDRVKDPFDLGLGGVVVTAYDAGGSNMGSVVTAADGTYTLTTTGPGPYRLEFGGEPGYLDAGFTAGASEASAVRFLPDGDSVNVDLAVIDAPRLVLTPNPPVVTTCFVDGPFNGPNGAGTALISVPYDATGHDFTGTTKTAAYQGVELAQINVLGSAYGLVWQKAKDRIYAAAFHKRYSGFGPSGPDAIYLFDNAGSLEGVIDLDALLGTTNSAGPDYHNFAADPGDGRVYDLGSRNGDGTYNNEVFAGVGKVSFGDLEIGPDGRTLYVVNLFDRKIYAIFVPDGTAAGASYLNSWDTPDETGAGRHRPFGLAWHLGRLWVGSVDENASNAYVHSFDPAGGTFNLELTVPLDYPRQSYMGGNANDATRSAEWRPWADDPESVTHMASNSNEIGYPQPILSDLAFDGYDMILGFRDRFGDQTGSRKYFRRSDTALSWGVSAGDLLRACWNGSSFVLETGLAAHGERRARAPDPFPAWEPAGLDSYWWDSG